MTDRFNIAIIQLHIMKIDHIRVLPYLSSYTILLEDGPFYTVDYVYETSEFSNN